MNIKTYRGALLMSSAAIALLSLTGCGQTNNAAQYPTKPIDVIVNYPAGGSTDVVGRGIVEIIEQKNLLDTRVNLINRSGGAGTTGVAEVTRADPDGYTVGFTTSGAVTIQPYIAEAPFKKDDVAIFQQVALNDVVVAVPANSELQSLEDLLTAAKSGGFSIGEGPASYHYAASLIEQAADVHFNRVDFSGDATMAKALLSGDVPAGIMGLGGIRPFVDSGDLRVISILGDERSSFMPDVPTASEAGVDVSASVYFWAYGSPNLPEDVANALSKAFAAAAATPEFEKLTKNIGVQVSIKSGEEAMQIAEEIQQSASTVLAK